ncbi:type II toxin-antitoxin system antitoxin SocA domain-containing protein [Natronococcus jeotgali]|uniref:Antitoxin SocA-like Panacea domain-containing protein n=1 Tax=Natronococcus jeotgali DSM 18795 TaxID=1227498 RepID=L9WTG2_9EURY|nr:type II toxin-antitoxin system antitoxin SocA domain-containing protein [Natronococcus jeotgali]ELY52764.1 hypothetical protein C492_19057 [Natronococcus jeotgali DSM 18795]
MVLDKLLGGDDASKPEKLLYLISSNSTDDGVLKGRKKLTKLVFFAEYWQPEDEMLNPNEQFSGFNFIIYKYGPFSKELFKAFDELKDKDLVTEKRRPNGHSMIHTTEKGRESVTSIEKKLSCEERDQVQIVRDRLSEKPGHELEDLSLNYLNIDKSEKEEYMGMPVSVVISEES